MDGTVVLDAIDRRLHCLTVAMRREHVRVRGVGTDPLLSEKLLHGLRILVMISLTCIFPGGVLLMELIHVPQVFFVKDEPSLLIRIGSFDSCERQLQDEHGRHQWGKAMRRPFIASEFGAEQVAQD